MEDEIALVPLGGIALPALPARPVMTVALKRPTGTPSWPSLLALISSRPAAFYRHGNKTCFVNAPVRPVARFFF